MNNILVPENIFRTNLLALFLDPNTSNAEPFPTFDIEINKEDKDSEVDKRTIKKDSGDEKPEDPKISESEED